MKTLPHPHAARLAAFAIPLMRASAQADARRAAAPGTGALLVNLSRRRRTGATVWYLTPLGAGPTPREKTHVIRWRDRFLPRLSVVPLGTEIRFRNDDDQPHGVFSASPGNTFDAGLLKPGRSACFTPRTGGIIKLHDPTRAAVNATVVVLPPTARYWSVAEGQGPERLAFRDVAPGQYLLRRFSCPTPGKLVRIEADRTSTLDAD